MSFSCEVYEFSPKDIQMAKIKNTMDCSKDAFS